MSKSLAPISGISSRVYEPPRKSDWPSPSISLTLLITLSSYVVSTFTDVVPKSSPFRWCSRVLVFPLMFQSLSLPTDTMLHSCGLWRASTRKIRRVEHEFYDIYHMANLQKRNSFLSLAQHVSREFRMNVMETYDVLCLVFHCVMRNRLCRMNVRSSWTREAKRGWFGEFTM